MPPEEVIERPLRGEAVSAALRFCGRYEELKQLTERWRLASDVAKPSPQVVVVKAERGVGKTRLVLEFYRRLRRGGDKRGYWPDALGIVDRNLAVNPEPENCKIRDLEIPYLWWAVRATDPGRENSVAGDAIATYDRYLAPHLVTLLIRENALRTRKAVARVWAEAIGDAVVSDLIDLEGGIGVRGGTRGLKAAALVDGHVHEHSVAAHQAQLLARDDVRGASAVHEHGADHEVGDRQHLFDRERR